MTRTTHRIDRRTLTRALALGGGAALAATHAVTAAPSTTGRNASAVSRQSGGALTGIGLPRSAWEDTWGAGDEIDSAWALSRYDNPYLDGTTVYAAFTDDIVSHIEMDFSALDGGISGKDAATFLMALLPLDAEPGASYVVAPTVAGRITYQYGRMESASLARATGGTGLFLVGSQEIVPYGPGGTTVVRITVTADADGDAAAGWGQPGGLGLERDDFEDAWGEGEATQGPALYAGAAIGGGDMLVSLAPGSGPVREIRVTWGDDVFTDGTDGESAGEQLYGTLPADAVRTGLFFLAPTPDGPVILAVEQWQSDELGDALGGDTALTVTWVGPESTDETLIVPRLDMVCEE